MAHLIWVVWVINQEVDEKIRFESHSGMTGMGFFFTVCTFFGDAFIKISLHLFAFFRPDFKNKES